MLLRYWVILKWFQTPLLLLVYHHHHHNNNFMLKTILHHSAVQFLSYLRNKCQNVTLKGQSHSWFCWMTHTTHTRNCLSYTFMRKVTLAVWTNDLLYLQSTGLQGLPVTNNKIRHPTQHSLALLTWNSKLCKCWWPARWDYTTVVLVLTTYSKDVAPERQHESSVVNTL